MDDLHDPVEDHLVEQAARDCLATLNDNVAIAGASAACVKAISKFVRSGNKLIRVHVSFVETAQPGQ